MEAVSALVTQVRTAVRKGELENQPTSLRHFVEDLVAAGVNKSSSTARDLTETTLTTLTGFGALEQYLADPTIEEIWINEPGRIFVARNGFSQLTPLVLTSDQVRALVEQMLAQAGRRVDVSSPFVDASLPDGSRLHVVIPEITAKHWAVNIRKFVAKSRNLQHLVESQTLTDEQCSQLRELIDRGANIVVAGATAAGKTTLLNALLNSAPPSQRIVTCEEVFELRLFAPDWIAMQTRPAGVDGGGAITLRHLVKEALRMRPDRLVIGEVRGAESLDLLIAMNSGLPSMCSIHANSASAAREKLTLLPLLAGSNVSADFASRAVATAVDAIVFISNRKVREIVIA